MELKKVIKKPKLENFNKKDSHSDKNNNSTIPVRLNVLLGLSGFLLLLLIIKLGMLTIISGKSYSTIVNQTEATVETTEAPRGVIYDSTGKVLAGNKSIPSISFERLPSITSAEIYKSATRLSKYLTIDTSALTETQEIDYYLTSSKHSKETIKKLGLSNSAVNKLTSSALYKLEVKYLKKNKLELSSSQKNAAAIYNKMAQTTSLSTTTLKSTGVTTKEISEIGERLSQFPGIRINQGWTRYYPQGSSSKTLLGSLSGSPSGLPASSLSTYLAEGYSRTDSVGISGIEKEYEQTLRGISKKTQITTNSQNKIVSSKVTQSGTAGKNLQLTINSKFQSDVSAALKKYMGTDLTTGGYAAVMNPKTGGLYAMAGWDRNVKTGKLTQNDLAVIQDPIVMGSAVKPAMVSMALQAGVITPTSSTQDDQIIKLAGTAEKHSDFNPTGVKIPLTAEQALEDSSNTYMIQLALKMNGTPYVSGMSLNVSSNIWQKMRNGFGEFGLGSRTGIDLPGETAGYKGSITGSLASSFIDEAFGQYDTYSVIQMARFVSTIANGGYLVQPKVVASVLKSGKNGVRSSVASEVSPTIQGYVKMNSAQWNVIKTGMWDVANGSSQYNTGGTLIHELSPKVAAKTGTAESFVDGQQTQNDTLIMYSPYAPFAIAIAYVGDKVDSFGAVEKAAAAIYNAFWKDVMPKPND
ncbi:cell division protein FtsI [Oenococcus oeni S25]|uniref:peptidoglycan D,D-transpeptidase FtsI family protein n=1 Tax=Oenococcus oeni TaxID=1247 RepID=UPI00050DDEB4|nr:penicillin-binding transpeptidase domain-containing protein [Oenococcus oeni]KGH70757.1 cell division protein FtsI [Oenococcus oeni S25]KGH80760.1 cell division protein FtsI [Oenococcus oeni IOEB_0607]